MKCIETGLLPHQLKTHRKRIDHLLTIYHARSNQAQLEDEPYHWALFLQERLRTVRQAKAHLLEQFRQFQQGYQSAASWQRDRILSDFIETLGNGEGTDINHVPGDFPNIHTAKALHSQRIKELTANHVFLLGRLGYCVAKLLKESAEQAQDLWLRLSMDIFLREDHMGSGSAEVTRAAITAIHESVNALPASLRQQALSEFSQQYFVRLVRDTTQELWTREQALKLLAQVSPKTCTNAIRQLSCLAAFDDFFIRSAAARLLTDLDCDYPLLAAFEADSSSHVRGAFARSIPAMPFGVAFPILVRMSSLDLCESVRAQALLGLQDLVNHHDVAIMVHDPLLRVLREESSAFCLRVAIEVVVTLSEYEVDKRRHASGKRIERFRQALEGIRISHEDTSIRRRAAEASERLWCCMDEKAHELYTHLSEKIQSVKQGEAVSLNPQIVEDRELLARVMSVLAQRDPQFQVVEGDSPQLEQVSEPTMRFWSMLHGLLHPIPRHKSQGSHILSRHGQGYLEPPVVLATAPASMGSDESLYLSDEKGWRPYLPLPDDLLRCLDHSGDNTVTIVTSEGKTHLRGPDTFLRRFRAFLSLSLNFTSLSRLRSWKESDGFGPGDYVARVRAMGFGLEIEPKEPGARVDARVARFF